MDAADEAAAPPAAAPGTLPPRPSLLQRAADHAKRQSTKLFSALAVLLGVAGVTAVAFLSYRRRYRFDPLLQLSCAVSLTFYGALYLRRRLRRSYAWLRRGLGYLAAASGALMSLLFFTCLPPAFRSWQEALGAWLLLAVAAYCFYRILVLHLDEEEEHADAAAALRLRAQA